MNSKEWKYLTGLLLYSVGLNGLIMSVIFESIAGMIVSLEIAFLVGIWFLFPRKKKKI